MPLLPLLEDATERQQYSRFEFVQEMIERLHNDTVPSENTKVDVAVVQDNEDDKHLRLTPDQVQLMLKAPSADTLKGLRDTAIIAIMACTGIREAELAGLDVSDLSQKLDGELSLRVRKGKGNKQRLVPYGPMVWCLQYVQFWLQKAEISEGPVFRGFYKGGKRVRSNRLSTRTVIRIIQAYPAVVEVPDDIDPTVIRTELRTVNPHDLRRTYARNAYLSHMDIVRIQQNLGHADIKTTEGYIGELKGHERRPPAMYSSPHNLNDLEKLWMVEVSD